MSKKTLYFDKVLNYTVAAATENGRLVNCNFETEDGSAKQGNIYKGVIKSLLDGMQAAFVDCGLERNCYLPAEDLSPWCGSAENAPLNFNVGDEVIVQVVKPPVGKKGAKVTTRLSFIGKSVIYLPETDFTGVSHKITDNELRANLMLEAKNAKRKGEGVVVRSAAPFCTYEYIAEELEFLRKRYAAMLAQSKNVQKGLIYSDYSLPLRILRDNNTDDIEKIIVGNEQMWKNVNEIISTLPGKTHLQTQLYAGTRDMYNEYGIAQQIYSTLLPEVQIEGGANLVIQRTEALTVIDVNTAKFVGDDNYEQTVYQTNLAAAREIARQVRLRNIGGIVVVDFIDMKEQNHRDALAYELSKALQKDPAQCKVLPMSEFGLIEFTRRRTGKCIADVLLTPCKRCGGRGVTLIDDIVLLKIRAEILRLLDGGAACVTVQTDHETAQLLLERKDLADDLRGKFPSAAICIKAEKDFAKSVFVCTPSAKRPALKDDAKTLY